jgi:hypothetical protein
MREPRWRSPLLRIGRVSGKNRSNGRRRIARYSVGARVLVHLALAAFAAIFERRDGDNLSALALPPFLPRATAAGSLPCSSGVGSRSSTSPLAISIMSLASWPVARAFGMGHDWWSRAFNQSLHSGPNQLMASAALLKPLMCSCWPLGCIARMYQSSPTLLGNGSNLILSGALAILRICPATHFPARPAATFKRAHYPLVAY